jgi:alkylated DNA repair dioxygenase AlkB
MKCPIDPSIDLKPFRVKVFGDIYELAKGTEPFDLDAYMKGFYDIVLNHTNDEALALDYARLIPLTIKQLLGINPKLEVSLLDNNALDSIALTRRAAVLEDATQEELTELGNKLKGVSDELENANEDPPVETTPPVTKEQEEAFEKNSPVSVVTMPALTQSLLDIILNRVKNTLVARTVNEFQPLTPYATRKQYNEGFIANVQRSILAQVEDAMRRDLDATEIEVIDENGAKFSVTIELRMVPSSTIINDPKYAAVLKGLGGEAFIQDDQKSPNGVMLVLTDTQGEPVLFSEDGAATLRSNGQGAAFTFPKEITGKEDQASIKQVADELGIEPEQARKDIFEPQIKALQKAREYALNNPGKPVRFQIIGGSYGFIEIAKKRNKVDSIDKNQISKLEIADSETGTDVKRLGLQKKEKFAFITVDGMYGQPIILERPGVGESGLADMLTSLIVDELNIDTPAGIRPLSPKERQELLNQYLNTGKKFDQVNVVVADNGKDHVVIANGETVVVTQNMDANERKALKQKIYTKLTANKKGGFPLVKVHVWKGGINGQMQKVQIQNGLVTLETIPYLDFVYDNFYMEAKATNGKLQRQKPYLVFEPIQETVEEVNADEIKEEEELNKKAEEEQEKINKNHEPLNSDGLNNIDFGFDSDYNKTFDQKNQNKKATLKQIEDAKTWYKKSPISQYVLFDEFFNMVNTGNGNAIAKWTMAGITLYKGSDYTDLYHEAWHAFTQAFMTSKQRQGLYKRVRNKTGKFKDHTGKTVSFRYATELQLEEYLAEAFREYMLNPKSNKFSPQEKTFFQKILDALRKLFGDREYALTERNVKADLFVQEMFEKLRVGDIAEYSFNMENNAFAALDKGGVRALEGYQGVQQLSYENTMKMVNSIDSLISEFVDITNSGLTKNQVRELLAVRSQLKKAKNLKEIRELQEREEILSGKKNTKKTYKFSSVVTKDPNFLMEAYRYAAGRLSIIRREKQEEYNNTTNPIDKEVLKKQLDILSWSLNNFGNLEQINHSSNKPGHNSTGLIAKHKEKSAEFFDETLKTTLDYENMREEDSYMGKQWDKNGNEQSMMELAKSEVVYLLKQIHKRDKDGNKVFNEFGIPETEEFSKMWNRLARALENTPDAEAMVIKLNDAAKDFPQFKDLLNKLGPLQTNSLASLSLWSNFFNTFGLARVPLIQVTINTTIDEDGNVTSQRANVGAAFNADLKIGRDWQTAFTAAPEGTYKFIKKDKEGSYLDIQGILQKYKTAADANVNGGWDFFNDIGFTLTDSKALREALVENKGAIAPGTFWKALDNYSKNPKTKNERARSYSRLFSDVSGRYTSLQRIEAKYSDVFSSFMVTNAEGNTQFEHTLNNYMTMVVNSINLVKDYQELLNTPHLAHLDVNKNPFAQTSVWLKSMFNLDVPTWSPTYGIRKQFQGEDVKLEVINLSGILRLENNQRTEEGISSAKADKFTKFIMDMHLAYNNRFELPRHSDKGTSYGIRLTGPIGNSNNLTDSYIPAYDFANATDIDNIIYEKFLPHIIAEAKRIKITTNALKDKGLKDVDFDYLEQGQEFVAFAGVLNTAKTELLEIAKSENISLDALAQTIKNNAELNTKLRNDVAEYFAKSNAKNMELFKDSGEFLSDNTISDFKRKYAKDNNGAQITTENANAAIVYSNTVNTFLHYLETMSVIYGDLAQYRKLVKKQAFHKRNAGAGSTGKVYRVDAGMKGYINQDLNNTYAGQNKDRLGLDTLRGYDGTFNTAIIADNKIASLYPALRELGQAYNDMEEGDGQGIISFDAYRQLKLAEGSWTQKQQNLYSKIIKGQEIKNEDVTRYFPVLKAQYWGPLKSQQMSDLGLTSIAMHKFSLYPAIPNVVDGRNMGLLHDRMVQEGIDYVTFQSGSKIGIINENKSGPKKIYKDDFRQLAFAGEPYDPNKPFFTKNTIFLQYLKNQLDINDKEKNQTIFSTQFRKLVEDGLFANGVPIDFKPEIKKPIDRMRAWARLSTEQKKAESNYYTLVKRYETTIGKLVDLAEAELLEEMNWTKDPNTGQLSGDKEELLNFITRELSRKELAAHELEFLAKGVDLSLSLNAATIEKMLTALIVNKLVKQKINGEALVQVATTLMESADLGPSLKFTNPTQEQIDKYGSNDLPFYTQAADGTTNAMKVKVALQGDFKNLLYLKDLDGNTIGTIEKLNELIKNEEWLNKDNHRKMITMTAVRIPVQGLNSMEFMEVFEFLPATSSGIIIVPSEIVAKSGADFDIDKMTVMMPNISREIVKADRNSKFWKDIKKEYPNLDFSKDNLELLFDLAKNAPEMLSAEDQAVLDALNSKNGFAAEYATGDNKKGLQNELITNLVDILKLNVNFKPLVTPNSTDLFTEKRGSKESLVDELSEDTEAFNPTMIFEIPYNLKKHQENGVGKATLGLGAVDNTYNTLFNRVGAYLNSKVGVSQTEYFELVRIKEGDFKNKSQKEVAKIKRQIREYQRQKIFLNHNTIDTKDGTAISLSHSKSYGTDQSISDIINQMINGWVDVAADTWIFNIQGNKEISPTLLFMIQAGVPVDTAVYFVSNPLIKRYVEEQQKSKSIFSDKFDNRKPSRPTFFRQQALANILVDPQYGFSQYGKDNDLAFLINNMAGVDSKGLSKIDEYGNVKRSAAGASAVAKKLANKYVNRSFDAAKLEAVAKKNKKDYSQYTAEENKLNRDVFLHFIELEQMGKAVRDLKMNMNVDTSRDQSLYEAESRLKTKRRLERDSRFPSFIIDRLIDDSPIGKFFVQKLQIDLIGGLFPLRNHSVINSFIDNLELDQIKGWNNKEDFANEFKDEFINFIFQNELKSFNLEKLDKNYKGYDVISNAEEVTSLEYGVAFKDGVMYISKADLREQFFKLYRNNLGADYKRLGLATVTKEMFKSTGLDEYVQFVIERERLRANTKNETLANDIAFKQLLKKVSGLKFSSEEAKYRTVREVWLRNKALENTFNNYHMFEGQYSYAQRFLEIKGLYPQLSASYSIMNVLDYVGSDKPGNKKKNLRLNNKKLSADEKNVLYENLQQLQSSSVLKTQFPNLTEADIKFITEFFQDFDMYAYLQTGINGRTSFTLTSIVDEDDFISIAEFAKDKAEAILDSQNIENAYQFLREFLQEFKANNNQANRSKKGRGPNYKADNKSFTETGLVKYNTKEHFVRPDIVGEIEEIEEVDTDSLRPAGQQEVKVEDPKRKDNPVQIGARFFKDQVKAYYADGIIGYGVGSTGKYAKAFGGTRTTFSPGETIMISVNGKGRPNQAQNVERTKQAIDKAIASGVSFFIADNLNTANSSHNKSGEGVIRDYLLSKGLEYKSFMGNGLYTVPRSTISNPNIAKNSDGLVVIENQLTEKESAAMVDSFKPLIEETSFKQTGGSVSWGFGLQWMRINAMSAEQRKGLVVGKQLNGKEITQAMKDDFINAGNTKGMPLYGYTNVDINGKPLPKIPNEIIEMLAEKGIDISEYDASYNSVYDKKDGGSLIIHQDNTELNESPIITISLGRPMKFVTYELNNPKDFDITDSKNTAYNILKNLIGDRIVKKKLVTKKLKYGDLTPATILEYAKQLDKLEGGNKYEQQTLDVFKEQFKGDATITEYNLNNGTVLVFAGNNRNVLHEIVFDQSTDNQPMPQGFPTLKVNKAFKGLGQQDRIVETNDYRVVLTLRKVQGQTVDNINQEQLLSSTKEPVQTDTSEGKYKLAKDTFNSTLDGPTLIQEMKNNPDVTYIYNGVEVVGKGSGNGPVNIKNKAINDSGLSNTIPLRSNKRYAPSRQAGGFNNDMYKDIKDDQGRNVIDPNVKEIIDEDIKAIQDEISNNGVVRFDSNGYGQSLLKKDKNQNMFAPQTFVYLSQQLYEKFGYLNPGYLELDISGTKPGVLGIQNAQEISDVEIKELNDEAVRDLMKLCKL